MFNSLQTQIIIGSLLGDASLIATGSGKRYRYSISHCNKQKAYLFWKYTILKQYVRTPPRLQKQTNAWKFNTISLDEFTEWRNSFYNGKQKVIPSFVKNYLTEPLTLAVWYMDDGNLRRQNGKIYGCMLNTQSYTYADNQKLQEWFHDLWNINSYLQKNHNKYRLYFGSGAWKELCAIVTPHIHSSMRYKLP